MRLLLKYKQYWAHQGPILLVTYSNHALNQFLNFVKTFTDKIVRVGGKTEEGLEQFGLWEQLKSRPKLKGQWKINKRIE